MAYRFKSGDRSVTAGVQRIAAAEFSAIAATLADRAIPAARKVHEARKSTKRLRALVRLTADDLPGAREEIAALRASAASLSALRDGAALGEIALRLGLPDDTTRAITQALADRPLPGTAQQARILATFAEEIAVIAARAKAWHLQHDGWSAIGPGLERGYTRFCRAFGAAQRAASDEPVHTFRKRAKDHWYQTLLLRGVFPEAMDGYAAAGEQLSDDLGDWRDLGLLQHELGELPAHVLSKMEAASGFEIIAEARRRALRRAFRTASRLTAETPEAYAARLRAWWKAFR